MNILIFLPFLSIIGFSVFIAQWKQLQFNFTVPFVLSSVLTTLFISDVFGILYYSSAIITALGVGLLLFKLICNRELLNKIYDFKLEILLVIILLLAVFTVYQHCILTIWDDLAFWAVFSKEMFINDITFQNKIPSAVLESHYHYPRGPAYFHYFSMYFAGFSQSGLLTSHFLMHFLLAMPFFAGRYFFQGLLCLITLYYIPYNESLALKSIYNDSTIGFVAACCLATFFNCINKRKAIILLIPTFFMFPIYREIGLWIGIYTAIIIGIFMFFMEIERFNVKHKILTILSLIFLVIISNYLWFLYVDIYGKLGREPHELSQFTNIINEIYLGNEIYLQIIKLFTSKFISNLSNSSFKFIYISTVLTFLSIIYFNKKDIKEYSIIMSATTLCFVLFLLFRLYIYLLMYDKIYGTLDGSLFNIGCIIRYSASYLIIFVAINCIYINRLLNNHSFSLLILILGSILTALMFIPIKKITKTMLEISYLDNNKLAFIKQTDIIKQLKKTDSKLIYNFQKFHTPNEDITEIAILGRLAEKCYGMSFYLYPFYTNADRINCLNEKSQLREVIKNDINSNIDINELMKNYVKYSCEMEYFPHLNYLNINCKHR